MAKMPTDNVNPAVDDRIRVTITVMDVNDAPEFAAETATRSVAENTVSDANIGIPVVAMDEDRPMQALTYALGGTDDEAFDIDGATGQLKTKEALNYEIKTDYEVTVTATDTGDGMDTITVTINVRNVSAGDTEVDNSAPAFTDGPSTTREVDENTKADVAFGAPVVQRRMLTGVTH